LQRPVEEPTTYATLLRIGGSYKLENLTLEQDVRDAVKECHGAFVEAYGPVPGWDLLVIADFPTSQSAIEFRSTLKTIGMWKVETAPCASISELTRIAKERKLSVSVKR